MADDCDRLPESKPTRGGLSVPSSSSQSSSGSHPSLFGLDKLAARKRAEGRSRPRKRLRSRSESIFSESEFSEQPNGGGSDTSKFSSRKIPGTSRWDLPPNPRVRKNFAHILNSEQPAHVTSSSKYDVTSKLAHSSRLSTSNSTSTGKNYRNSSSYINSKFGQDNSGSLGRSALLGPSASDSSRLGQEAYEEEEKRVEREWYLGDDIEKALPTVFDEEAHVRRQARNLTAKAAERHADSARWEERQMGSGLYAEKSDKEHQLSVQDESGPRVNIVVKELIPHFLQAEETILGNNIPDLKGSKSVVLGDHIIMPVRDPTSDMAVIAKKGSATVKEYREKRERGNARTKYWELGNTAGAKAKESAEHAKERSAKEEARVYEKSGDTDNWKKDMQFSSVLKRQAKNEEELSKGKEASVARDVNFRKSVSDVRRSLPVYSVRDKLMQLVREHQVVVVVGETGSGKTTQLTQYLYEEGYGRYGIIGCTQPRRVAAVSVAQRVAQEFKGGSILGNEVGYAIRFEDCTSSRTVIKYMTDGILLRESLVDPDVDRYSAIVMDEAHERSLNTDVLFGVLRTVITRRRDLKVIITSATLNAEKFANFFGNAPVFNIPGRTFPVDTFFAKTPVEDYVADAVFQVMQIHIQAPLPGDILVFMSGQEDIETTCELLSEKLSRLENPRPLLILPIYSQLAADLQAKIFEPATEGTRKVVVASNIAETSLTIDGIRFVVDSGFCKLKTYNPRLGMDALLLCPTSQASSNQRSGRAGRTGPGKCYRLFTASAYAHEMLESNIPEIQRTNLSHVVLLLKSLGVRDLLDFPFIDPPPAENILKSMLGLWLLGALDARGELTQLGRRMSNFPLDPALSGLLFMGEKYGCFVEAVTIVAMLSVPNVFIRPHGREEESDNAREKFFVPESDHLTLLHVYQRWRAAGGRVDWCTRHFINSKGMRKAREVREQLLEIAQTEQLEKSTCDDWETIRRAVAASYYYQAARRKGIGEYVNIRSGVICGLHPTSAIYGTGLSPDYVVYHELIFTKKEYMSCVTAVEPQWLAESGPLLYVLREVGVGDLKELQNLQRRRANAESSVRAVAELEAENLHLHSDLPVTVPQRRGLGRSRQVITGPGIPTNSSYQKTSGR